ncbi:MAG TPA: carboxypeptidase regulatory-like domain-containing protein [Bryobacteraceae bacterium]|nr:carboxypeptidase regulatory-like domain-containing protein [Bryobacteraceae bacterium]
MKYFHIVCFGCLISLVTPLGKAQVLYGSLRGTVEDPGQSAIPGAKVMIEDRSIGATHSTTTNGAGDYSFEDIQPGVYSLTVSAAGFKSYVRTNVEVTINTVTRVDTQLEIGQMTEHVEVSAQAAALQTDSADVHVSLGSREITQLPLPGYRNYQTLINLVPGASPAAYQNAVSGSPARSLNTNINGTTNTSNNTRLDGALNMRGALPAQSLYVPPAESIESVNVSTDSFDAEQGLAGGAAINVITKSGTNQFHGVVFEHHTDSRLTDRNFFNVSSSVLPKDIMNNYGGTFGGPIKKNKLFFFSSWEGMRERSNYTKLATVPTDAQRAGDFSALNVQLYDPATGNPNGTGRAPFPNNIIPLSRQSPITLQMQSLIPEANLPGASSNYFDSAPVSFNRDNVDTKVNWNQSDKTTLWAKYSAMKALVSDRFSLGPAGGVGMINGGGAGTGNVLMQVGAIGGVHTFTPVFLVDGTIAVSRDPLTLIGPDSGSAFGLDTLHIPGTNGPGPRYNGIPQFSISGYEPVGDSETYLPKYSRNTYFTYSVNFGWTKGSHEIRFGLDLARFRVNEWHPELGGGPKGTFTFDGSVTLPGTGSPNQFNNYAAFLLGLPQAISKTIEPDWMSPRQWMEGYYFRDRWQASRNLTLTLGLRWEYYPIMTYAHNGMIRFDPSTDNVYIGGLGSVPNDTGNTTSKRLFAPRAGVAYRLGSKTVLRGGYGISIDPQGPLAQMLFSYPNVVLQTWAGNTSYIPYGPIANGIPAIPYPSLSSGTVPLPLTTSTTSLPPGEYVRGYIESYNFTLQRELPAGFVGSVGYVGTHTVHENVLFNINAASPGAGNNGRPLAVSSGLAVNETFIEPFGSAKYNALQAQLDHQLGAGVQVKIAYTYSKTLNNVDNELGSLLFYDPANVGRDWSLASFDRPQNLRVAWVAELPFGVGKRWVQNGIGSKLLGGWEVNGIFSGYSGIPFTVTAAGGSLNAPGETQTADQVKPTVAKLGGIGANSPYFDPTAFAPVTAVRYGTSGRNILRGPGLVNVDAALFRNFQVKERWQLQVRAESYNLSNTPNFNNPSANVSSSGFMTITSALSRGNNVEGGERQFRFGLRISF